MNNKRDNKNSNYKKAAKGIANKTASASIRYINKSLAKKSAKQARSAAIKKGISSAAKKGASVAKKGAAAGMGKIIGILGTVLLIILVIVALLSLISGMIANTKSYLNPLALISKHKSAKIQQYLKDLDRDSIINPQDLDANLSAENFEILMVKTNEVLEDIKKIDKNTYNELIEQLDASIYIDEALGENKDYMPLTYKKINNHLDLEKSSYAWNDPRYPEDPEFGYWKYKITDITSKTSMDFGSVESALAFDPLTVDESNMTEVSSSEQVRWGKQNLRPVEYPFRVPWQLTSLTDIMLSDEKEDIKKDLKPAILRDTLAALSPIYTFVYPFELEEKDLTKHTFTSDQLFIKARHPIGFEYLGDNVYHKYDLFEKKPLPIKLKDFNYISKYVDDLASKEAEKIVDEENIDEENKKPKTSEKQYEYDYRAKASAFTLLDSNFSNAGSDGLKVSKAYRNDLVLDKKNWSYAPHNQEVLVSDEATVTVKLPGNRGDKICDNWTRNKFVSRRIVEERIIEEGSSGPWELKEAKAEIATTLVIEDPKLRIKRGANSLIDTKFSYEPIAQSNRVIADTGDEVSISQEERTIQVGTETQIIDGEEVKVPVFKTVIVERKTTTRSWTIEAFAAISPDVFNTYEDDASSSFESLVEDDLGIGKSNLTEFRDIVAMQPGGVQIALGMKGKAFPNKYIAPIELFNVDKYYDSSFAVLDDWLVISPVPLQTVAYSLDPYGDVPYGDGTLQERGSGPASMAMVLASYQQTFNIPTPPDAPNPVDPIYCADWAIKNNYYADYWGVKWPYFGAIADQFNVSTNQLANSPQSILKLQNTLRSGYMAIAAVKQGDFSSNGGFVALANLHNDKTITVLNPESGMKSGNCDIDEIIENASQFWIFTPQNTLVGIDISIPITGGEGTFPPSDSQIGTYVVIGHGSMAMPIIQYNQPGATFYISSGFGPRNSPTSGKYENHKGIDIPGPTSLEVCSVLDGRIITCKYSGTAGNYVAVDHGNGLVTKYMHMSSIRSGLEVGMSVKAGEKLGNVGSTGNSTGNHLHFQVERNTTALYPLAFLPAKKQ